MTERRRYKSLSELTDAVREALDCRDDTDLLNRIEPLADELAFGLLTPTWGWSLYRRNRVVFRPFIISNLRFAGWTGRRWRTIKWKGEDGEHLDQWLKAADDHGDVEVFRALYRFQLSRDPKAETSWRTDLSRRVGRARTPAAVAIELDKLDLTYALDEATATSIYDAAPAIGGRFIARHLPVRYRLLGAEKREPWRALWKRARERGDDATYLALYRRQVPVDEWLQDSLRAIDGADDPDAALEARHPIGFRLPVDRGFLALLEAAGATAVPYVARHLDDVWAWSRSEKARYRKLVQWAEANGQTALWAAIIRRCAPKDDFDRVVKGILNDGALSDAETVERLALLGGGGREFNGPGWGLVQVRMFSDANATQLYQSYPGLVRGPFRASTSPSYQTTYPMLMAAAMEQRDWPVVDHIASRLVTRPWTNDALQVQLDELVEHHRGLDVDPVDAAERAASVLGRVPPYSIWSFRDLVRNNPFARLLYRRSSSKFLAAPDAIRDLLEAAEIHAQTVAFAALALDREDARTLAAENIDLLVPTLLRPLHRKSRALALGALTNAAIDEAHALRIVSAARTALALPDHKYPKDLVIELIGQLIHRHPALRHETEQPVVYRGAA